MTEEWREIPGFPGYEVSTAGRVRSYYRKVAGGQYSLAITPQRILKPGVNKDGRKFVCLSKDRKVYARHCASLVLLAFVGPRPKSLEVCHGDNNPSNDNLGNLRYDTRANNIIDAIRDGLRYKKLSLQQVAEIRTRRAQGEKVKALAKEYGVRNQLIECICRGDERQFEAGPRTTRVIDFKLTDQEIVNLRSDRATLRLSEYELARKYGLTQSYVSMIIHGLRRRGAGGPIEGSLI